MAQTRPIRIGTRGSRLALWQARAVGEALAAARAWSADRIEILPIRTSGDRIRDRALADAGGKGLFTKEIEEQLAAGTIDLAVHSAKDMETFLRPGLLIGACLQREDARDALISRHPAGLDGLPTGAFVGTASIRREALLRRVRPDLRMGLLRGNVPTRLGRVEAGDFDATLLAAAGLNRLEMQSRIAAYLPLDSFPPACGQGAIAVECRDEDGEMRDLLAAIDNLETARALACERAFLAALDGSCRTPIAGHAVVEGGTLRFAGMILSEDGQEFYEAANSGDASDAAAIGRAAGEDIRRRARPDFLARLGIA
jgi:hydroxymethylbilane synthase